MKIRSLSKILQYIILCFVLAAIIFFLILSNGNPENQKILVILGCAWYVIWGYYHHAREGSLDLAVIAEYLTYGVLGAALILSILL